jgi:hypothetical protein
MRPDYGAIQEQMRHLRVMGNMGEHLVPDTLVTPTGEALV